jgi:hypothetical protein
MIVGVRFMAASLAQRIVLLPIVRNNAVGDIICVETVEDAVDRSAVDAVADGGQDLVVTQSGTRLFEGG